jgi:hypothetical protein
VILTVQVAQNGIFLQQRLSGMHRNVSFENYPRECDKFSYNAGIVEKKEVRLSLYFSFSDVLWLVGES